MGLLVNGNLCRGVNRRWGYGGIVSWLAIPIADRMAAQAKRALLSWLWSQCWLDLPL